MLVIQTPAHRKENTGGSYGNTSDLVLRKRNANKIPTRYHLSAINLAKTRGWRNRRSHPSTAGDPPRWLCRRVWQSLTKLQAVLDSLLPMCSHMSTCSKRKHAPRSTAEKKRAHTCEWLPSRVWTNGL